jgi:trk system potassium uptake protein TrkA
MRTARVLREEGHEVTLVEPDRKTVDRLTQEGYDVVQGDGSQEDVLLDLDLESVDGLAALSGEFDVNVLACMIAKSFGCRTVLRASSDYEEYALRKYASDVDEVVYPERLGAIVAKNALLGGSIRAIADIAKHLQIVELTITDGSPMHGYTLSELELPADSRLLAFGKKDGTFQLPSDDESLETGDRVIILADYEHLTDVRRLIVGDSAAALAAGGSA